MITLSDRSSTFTDSVIRRMSRVCAKYGALNLAQGFPDYNPPEPILERLSKVAFEVCDDLGCAELSRSAL